jgi:hypothetical protein
VSVASLILRGVGMSSAKVAVAECRQRQEDRDEQGRVRERQKRRVFGEPGLAAGADTAEEFADCRCCGRQRVGFGDRARRRGRCAATSSKITLTNKRPVSPRLLGLTPATAPPRHLHRS